MIGIFPSTYVIYFKAFTLDHSNICKRRLIRFLLVCIHTQTSILKKDEIYQCDVVID